MTDPTKPDDATRDAERNQADQPAAADRMPTPEEEQTADALELDPSVVEHEREMAERGKNQSGEGRLP